MREIPGDAFTAHWAGYATAVRPYHFQNAPDTPLYQFIQRCGEKPSGYHYKGFACTRDTQEVPALLDDFPKRWHVEEFFNANQALGWNRAGTLNLNVRYGQMSMALIAQAAIHQLRNRLGEPYAQWDAAHLARDILRGLDGDIRVEDDTIHVNFYNAPNAKLLAKHYENLPQKLLAEKVNPHIPWLYNFKLDSHFNLKKSVEAFPERFGFRFCQEYIHPSHRFYVGAGRIPGQVSGLPPSICQKILLRIRYHRSFQSNCRAVDRISFRNTLIAPKVRCIA